MPTHFALVLAFFALAPTSSGAQTKVTEHTVKPSPNARPASATIADMAWLAGHWTGDALGGLSEEIWSPPRNGMMLGMYRLMKDGKAVFYELLTLAEEEGSLIIRLKHFNADMTGWEEKDKHLSFPLVQKTGDLLQFSGMTFRRDGPDHATVFLAIDQKDGTVREEVFRYRRQASLTAR